FCCFFFQAEDGIRDRTVTGVQTCALPILTNKLTVIGKSAMATVRLQGWFKPQMAAQINQLDDGYYLGAGDKVPSINGRPISGPVRLSDGDLVEVSGVRLNFIFRE